MSLRQLLRTGLVGTRTAHLSRLHRVCRAEVAALNITCFALFLVNISLSLAAADNSYPAASPGGGCGRPAEPHHQEVRFTVLPRRVFWHVLFTCWQQIAAQSFCFLFLCVMCQRTLCTKSDEVRLAEEASRKYGSPAPTIFSKVIDKSIPADIIYEDEKVNKQQQCSKHVGTVTFAPFHVESVQR